MQVSSSDEVVHGRTYLCVVVYAVVFASERLHSITSTLTKVMQAIRRLAVEIAKPEIRFAEDAIKRKLNRWLASPYISDMLTYDLQPNGKGKNNVDDQPDGLDRRTGR